MCWFEAGITKSSASPLAGAPASACSAELCVHYDNEPERRAAFLEAIADGMPGGYGVDDYAGLLWEGEDSPSALTARRGARAYRVRRPRRPASPSRPWRPASSRPRLQPPCAKTSPSSGGSSRCAGGRLAAGELAIRRRRPAARLRPSPLRRGSRGRCSPRPRSRLSLERSTTFSKSFIKATSSTCSLTTHCRNCSARKSLTSRAKLEQGEDLLALPVSPARAPSSPGRLPSA